jgi:type IV secretion system protein VirB5
MKLKRILERDPRRGVPALRAAGGPPVEPSLGRGRREWDDRYAGLARGKRNWQLAALGLLAVDGLLTAGIIHLASQSRVTPFVVEVDRLGQSVAFGPAEQLRKTDERLIRYQLNLFVRDVRSIFADGEVQKTVINRAYAHAKDGALTFLNDYFKKSNPFLRAAEGTVTVQVQSVLRLSARSWQVQWRETQLAPGGRVVSETAWQAVLGVELVPPDTTDALLVNPLGLYVTDINWTKTL